jgi:hypothetical protein
LAGAVATVEGIVVVEPLLATDSPATVAQLVASWTAPSARSGLEAQLDAARAALLDAPGGPYRFDAATLEARAILTGPATAAVDAWCSEVVLAQERPLYAAYLTEHFALTWTGRTWLVTSTSDTVGPSVALPTATAVTPPAEAQAALAGFAPVGALIEGGS